MTFGALEAFDAECAAFAEAVDGLGAAEFGQPSNCPPWTVHEVVVHTSWSIRLPERLPLAGGPSVRNASDYYRRAERNTTEYRQGNVDRTRDIAGRVELGAAAGDFRSAWKAASAAFAVVGADDVIALPGGAMTCGDYVLTRLMSVAAHGVDVALSFGGDAWTTVEALSALRPVLIDLLGADPPMSWSDQQLLDFGSGRLRLGPEEERALGALRDRFPLFS